MLTLQYTVVCEFARPEIGGKWTLVGLFPNGIGTPMIPFPLPALTFYQVIKADTAGQYKLRGKLTQLDNGRVLASVEGAVQVGQPNALVVAPITLMNVKFTAFGIYTWSVEVDGQPDPFVTEFQVAHVPNAGPVQFMPPRPPGA